MLLPSTENEVEVSKEENIEASGIIVDDSNVNVSSNEENFSHSKGSSKSFFNTIQKSQHISSGNLKILPVFPSVDSNEFIDETISSESSSLEESGSDSVSSTIFDSFSGNAETSDVQITPIESSTNVSSKDSSLPSTTTSASLSSQDIRDAEELFGILL
ncbi:MAG: hypothetical protein LBH96_04625 [Candidatus Peribacteria bacterium]|nr:hypothetical protein [Candidatus Peribacteria bacterium]